MSTSKVLDIAFHHRTSTTVDGAVLGTGLGRSSIYKLIKSGKVRMVKVGRRSLIDVPSLLAAINMENVGKDQAPS